MKVLPRLAPARGSVKTRKNVTMCGVSRGGTPGQTRRTLARGKGRPTKLDAVMHDILGAILSGEHIRPTLREHNIAEDTFYTWLSIGGGKRTRWRNGRPITAAMLARCRDFYQSFVWCREWADRERRLQALKATLDWLKRRNARINRKGGNQRETGARD